MDSYSQSSSKILSVYSPAVLVFIGCTIASVAITIFIHDQHAGAVHKLLATEARLIRQVILERFESRLSALDRMASRFTENSPGNKALWEKDAATILQNFEGVQAIEWADVTTKIQWIYPLKDNEAAVDLILNKEGKRNEAISLAKSSMRGTLTKPLALKQGGLGFLSLHPTLGSDRQVNGFIVGVYRADDIFGSIAEGSFSLAVKMDGKSLFESRDSEPLKNSLSATVTVRNIEYDFIVSSDSQAHFLEQDTSTFFLVMMCFCIAAAIFTYILYRKHSELQESLRVAKSVKDTLDEIAIYAETDKSGVITLVNDNFCEISGYTREEIIGKTHRIINSGFHSPEFFQKMWKQIAGGNTWSGDICNKAKDGTLYWEDTSIIPMIQKNQIVGYSAIRYDISRRKIAEQEALKQREIAENAFKARSMFLANMSHEIRTPMNGVMGMIALLKDDITEPKQKEKLAVIESSGELLVSIVNDILDLSKIETGNLELEDSPFSPKSVVEQVTQLFYDKASSQRNSLKMTITPDIPAQVLGDSHRLKQVLMNLISNAIKFCSDGQVQVKVSISDKEKALESLVFSVSDTGIGIAESKIDKLFTNFTQVDQSTTRRFGGTGLGLAICKSIVNLWGGDISIDSRVNEGTTLSFTLPIKIPEDNIQEPSLSQDSEDFDLSFAQILVAEDNEVNRLIMQGLLSKLGIKADFAHDGIQVLEKMHGKTYDLVLMDCHMPKMDGFETTRQIIQRFLVNKPPIVALTASVMKEDQIRCREVGMDDFLSKPIRSKILKETLKKHLKKSKKFKKAV